MAGSAWPNFDGCASVMNNALACLLIVLMNAFIYSSLNHLLITVLVLNALLLYFSVHKAENSENISSLKKEIHCPKLGEGEWKCGSIFSSSLLQ